MATDAPTPDQLGATPAWERALEAYARELSTGGASAATLRAYGRDLAELADWASARRREPGELAYRDLRAYAAALCVASQVENRSRVEQREAANAWLRDAHQ